MKRREFIKYSMAGATFLSVTTQAGASMAFFGGKDDNDNDKNFPYSLSKSEWKDTLTDKEYHVLRDHGTERAFTSPLNDEKRDGVYHCAGCDHPLFSSQAKFNSGTGWPSFWQPLNDEAIGTSVDRKLFMERTEVHCANCGGHQGHVFNDGPQPTGLRYCINGVALDFKPE